MPDSVSLLLHVTPHALPTLQEMPSAFRRAPVRRNAEAPDPRRHAVTCRMVAAEAMPAAARSLGVRLGAW
jgi:hypothetical protein